MEDMQKLREYIMAKDGHEYDETLDGMVILHVTHNLLTRNLNELRLDKHITVGELRHKLHRHTGTRPDMMNMFLTSGGKTVAALLDDTKMLGFYPVAHGMTIHVVDNDPYSLARGGGLDDVSLVKKYEMSEGDYDKREKTVRQYKKDQLAKDPNWVPKHLQNRKMKLGKYTGPTGPETIEGMKIGDRCEVAPGGRRGEVAYLGLIPELGEGHWVGVIFDEPVSRGDGTLKGKTYFKAEQNHGGYFRGGIVKVGDFPEKDIFAELDDSDEESNQETPLEEL